VSNQQKERPVTHGNVRPKPRPQNLWHKAEPKAVGKNSCDQYFQVPNFTNADGAAREGTMAEVCEKKNKVKAGRDEKWLLRRRSHYAEGSKITDPTTNDSPLPGGSRRAHLFNHWPRNLTAS
jgi:hypothetical protein